LEILEHHTSFGMLPDITAITETRLIAKTGTVLPHFNCSKKAIQDC